MIEFGVHIEESYGYEYDTVREIALEAERLGFDSIWLSDHFFLRRSLTERPCLECWTTLTALALEIRKIHVGPDVTCVSYRHPALLARIAASLDVISKGRVELGIGAGWKEDEYNAFGIPFQKPSIRIQQLKEALEIIRRLWTEEAVDFEGRYFRLEGVFCMPKPFQKPHPPIWVGGRGDRLLRVTAQFADYSNFDFHLSVEECGRRLEVLKDHCRSIGRDYDEIKKALPLYTFISEDSERCEDIFRVGAKWRGMSLEEYKAFVKSPILGTPEQCLKQIYRYIELGITYFILYFPDAAELEPLQLFAEQVMPEIRRTR